MISIADALDAFEASRNVDRDARVGPSDYGKCRRQIAYRVRGHEQGEPIESTRAATMGTLFWKGLGEFIAETYDDAEVELPVAVPGLERGGSADLRWVHDGVLVDVKTVSERAFDRVVTHGAKDENVGQLETYALGLNRRRTKHAKPITALVLAYVNRDNGDVHEVAWTYDEQTARERVSWLVSVEQAIDAGFEMQRDGVLGTGFPCDWCPFWRECWDVENTPDDRSHASKFTVDDAMIEDAIERYLDAAATESKAKRVKSEAREQLVGITYEHGGYSLKWSGGRTTREAVIDHEQLVILAVEHGLTVPMIEKSSTSSKRIAVKRTGGE
jgi:hypothetical protein